MPIHPTSIHADIEMLKATEPVSRALTGLVFALANFELGLPSDSDVTSARKVDEIMRRDWHKQILAGIIEVHKCNVGASHG